MRVHAESRSARYLVSVEDWEVCHQGMLNFEVYLAAGVQMRCELTTRSNKATHVVPREPCLLCSPNTTRHLRSPACSIATEREGR